MVLILYIHLNFIILISEDCETYNITKNNLVNAEQKINELTILADSQSKEINRLKDELQSQTSNMKRKNSSTHINNNISKEYEAQIVNLQKQLETEAQKFKEKCQLYEETETTMSEIIKDRG